LRLFPKTCPTPRAADGQGALPLPRGFSPKRRILRFEFFLPIPLPAANACRWATRLAQKAIWVNKSGAGGFGER